jgi:two-component system response regulator PilR (NtrC family)
VEKILVVDDEPSLRDVLGIMLKKAGYTTTLAADGEEAVSQVNKEITIW